LTFIELEHEEDDIVYVKHGIDGYIYFYNDEECWHEVSRCADTPTARRILDSGKCFVAHNDGTVGIYKVRWGK